MAEKFWAANRKAENSQALNLGVIIFIGLDPGSINYLYLEAFRKQNHFQRGVLLQQSTFWCREIQLPCTPWWYRSSGASLSGASWPGSWRTWGRRSEPSRELRLALQMRKVCFTTRLLILYLFLSFKIQLVKKKFWHLEVMSGWVGVTYTHKLTYTGWMYSPDALRMGQRCVISGSILSVGKKTIWIEQFKTFTLRNRKC